MLNRSVGCRLVRQPVGPCSTSAPTERLSGPHRVVSARFAAALSLCLSGPHRVMSAPFAAALSLCLSGPHRVVSARFAAALSLCLSGPHWVVSTRFAAALSLLPHWVVVSAPLVGAPSLCRSPASSPPASGAASHTVGAVLPPSTVGALPGGLPTLASSPPASVAARGMSSSKMSDSLSCQRHGDDRHDRRHTPPRPTMITRLAERPAGDNCKHSKRRLYVETRLATSSTMWTPYSLPGFCLAENEPDVHMKMVSC